MKKNFTLLFLLSAFILLSGETCNAHIFKWKKKAKTEKKDSIKKISNYDKFLKDKHEVHKGFITLYKSKGKVYFEIPDSLMERDMLLGSTVSSISDNKNALIGSKPLDPLHIKFSKVGKRVNLILIKNDYITNSNNKLLQQSLKENNAGSIIESFKITTYNRDSSAVVFDATDFFVADKKMMRPFDPYSFNTYGGMVTRMPIYESDKSYLGDVKSFKTNLIVKSYLSYKYNLSLRGRDIAKDVPFTALMTRSIILLDKTPYNPRPIDSRIGIFPTEKIMFNGKQQKATNIYFANRWRIEPKDTAAYKNGKLTEPKKPIIFYIDPAIPEEWQPAIYEAVNQWQLAFEKIGFKNAIMAKPFPKDNPEFDPDNIKYSCIRYAPIAIENAMGPSWVDPRSGEVLSASVYLYHNVVELINNWRYIQTSQTDESLRNGRLPKSELLDGLRYVISHEVGHCLGLMHNMGSSSTIPVDSLRSPHFTQKYGTTHSIMDYARFNYVAQPGDAQKGVKLTPPRLGTYDYYAIKVTYTPIFNSKGILSDYNIVSGWLSKAQKDPVLRYGKQQFGAATFDPHSLTEDLGDDAMKASDYGIKNLKYILSNLNTWVKDDTDFSYRKAIYTGICYQYLNYIKNVYTNIGGIYLHEKMVGDSVDAVRCVPRKTEKRAYAFLCNQIKDLTWLDRPELLENIQIMGKPSEIFKSLIVNAIINIPSKIEITSTLGEDTYKTKEALEDIYNLVWSPTIKGKKLSDTDMMLQREFVSTIFRNAGIHYFGDNTNSREITSVTQICTPDFLKEYEKENQNICYNKNTQANSNNEKTASYEQPSLYFIKPVFNEALSFKYIEKVKTLVKSRINKSSGSTKAHYELILRNIEKSLK